MKKQAGILLMVMMISIGLSGQSINADFGNVENISQNSVNSNLIDDNILNINIDSTFPKHYNELLTEKFTISDTKNDQNNEKLSKTTPFFC